MSVQTVMRNSLDLILSLCACAVVEGLRITRVDVPRYLVVGQKTRLKCHFALEGEVLYSLKWWKDGSQFYQFIPRNEPRMVVFTVKGVTVNVEHSSLHQVELMDVQSSSSGQYRCEVVAEAPTFTTHDLAANMTIVDPPDGPPKVHGLKPSYLDGDLVVLNCTSYRSRPPPKLSWAVERVKARASGGYTTHFAPVDNNHLVKYEPMRGWFGEHILAPYRRTYSSTLGLVLPAHRRLAPHGLFKLRCISIVHEYEWVTEVTVRVERNPVVEPHHLPTLLNTGAAVKASADQARSNVIVIMLATIFVGFVQRCLP